MAMPPWEQHASATALPRFNYNAPSTFSSLRGFLITCILDREKSATKEAIGFLKEYLKSPPLTVDRALKSSSAGEQKTGPVDQCTIQGHFFSDETNCTSNSQGITVQEREREIFCLPLSRDVDAGKAAEQSTGTASSKNASVVAITDSSLHLDKPYMSSVDIEREEEMAMTAMKTDASPGVVKDRLTFKECQASKTEGTGRSSKRSSAGHSDSCADDRSCFFLLKMAQKGIVSIFLENGISDDPVNMLSDVLEDIENGVRKPPQWFHRIVPVQASCALLRESLSAVVFKLVKQHLEESAPTAEQPLKYAIGYNRRGIEAKEDVVGRMDCITLVAQTIAKASPHIVADLGAPQMVVIIEVIPLVGVQGSPICGVAVLSGELVNVKPKLCVKPLSSACRRSKKTKL